MASIKPVYGTEAVPVTITLASLAANAARASAAIDNTTNLFLDAYVQVLIKTASAGVSATGTVTVFVYGTVDFAGTPPPSSPLYPEGITGSDALITINNPTNLTLAYTLNANVVSQSFVSEPFSIAQALNLPMLPSHWGLVILNSTGAALDSTAANHAVMYQGLQAQSV